MTTSALRILAKSPSPRRVRAFAIEAKTPPSEIQLWRAGDNPTDFGVHRWTDRSAAEVWARYAERGNPLLIDIEHNGAGLEGTPAATGGYARLDLRAGEPWLVFDWSAFGAEQIATGQRRFLSPEYDIDPNTNEIIRLYRVSLVADPATHSARILASAEEKRMDPKLAAIMAILGSVSDPAAAVEAIKSLVANLDDSGTTDDAPADDAPADGAPAFAAVGDDTPDDKDKPVVAAAPPPAKPVVAAAAPVATIPAAPAPPAAPVGAAAQEGADVRASRANADRAELAARDVLIAQHGHRLQPSIRTWASTQSLAIVRGLVNAAPKDLPAPPTVKATRGAAHGTGSPKPRGLEGVELETYQRAMGTFQASTPRVPFTNEAGDRVFPVTPPREAAARIAAAAAAKDGTK